MNDVTKRRRIQIIMKKNLMRTGSTQQVSALVESSEINLQGIKWFTSDRDIASVDDNGLHL